MLGRSCHSPSTLPRGGASEPVSTVKGVPVRIKVVPVSVQPESHRVGGILTQLTSGVRAVADRQTARLSKHAPQAHIVAAMPHIAHAGEPLSLAAIADDAEDGALSGSSLTWASSQDGVLGAGNTLWLQHGLSAGTHVLSLSATDSDGNTSRAETLIIVK